MKLADFEGKKVLILGFAREGQDSWRFLRKLFPGQVFGLADQKELSSFEAKVKNLVAKDRNLKLHFGPDYLKKIGDYGVVIKSPGIPPRNIKPFIKKGQKITSQIEIFFDNCPGKIIGVTGTKGKSTTASLIYEVLKSGELKAHLAGNIGQPVLSLLLKAKVQDIFVFELSSHQLMNLKRSPHIAVFLNIYPEHLDYYQDFAEYLKAKQNICRWQKKTDFFLFNPRNKFVGETAKITRAQKVALNPQKTLKFLKKGKRPGLLHFHLLGEFNLLNMAAAIEAGKIFKVPEEKISQAIKNFKPLPHRLEYVGKFKGIKFYNDSLATIPEATMAALEALGDKVETIFLGGFDRGLNFKGLANRILKSRLKTLILFPATGERIWQEICGKRPKTGFLRHFFTDNMEEGVKLAYKYTRKGKICLLSCASSSFGIFRDYQERGDLFKKYVRKTF